MIETYRGHKIRVTRRRTKLGTGYQLSIDGEIVGLTYGTTEARELLSGRGYIDDSIERPHAYTWSRT
ncbi:Uncharacterised protein [Mycobacteroides abscessus subsp. abscessus]|nr:Uncharacterised protein [Mycobacteroides abscessus subsp. abscessus]SIE75079.1 Uncharacterised protein [Mycobacteroides abscessus subsp. abscessus]SIG88570.1 Uncharacterised protein [Mycobacteroides abscessus subsp. abscessus]SIG93076.1 Uncharacterised protein [Mycobacteroides abscessus subsp. abscessus]SIH06307.1 Uncharacterised protein [Mycobacteroides abscessus subsp. abscessus]